MGVMEIGHGPRMWLYFSGFCGLFIIFSLNDQGNYSVTTFRLLKENFLRLSAKVDLPGAFGVFSMLVFEGITERGTFGLFFITP